MLSKTLQVLFLFLLLQGFITIFSIAEPLPSNVTPDVPSRTQTDAALESSDEATSVRLDRAVHFTTLGSVTFSKVVVTSIHLLNTKPSNQISYVNSAIAQAPNSALAKIEAFVDGVSSVKQDCLYKPTKNGARERALTCQ